MTQTILATGAAGFIGSNFVRLVHQCTDYQIVIVDALTYAGNLANISDLLASKRLTFIKGDIGDQELVLDLFTKYDVGVVVHFAAESHVDRSILEPRCFIKTNIEGTFNLLEAARVQWSAADKHLFLHVSSDEVFGSLNPEESPFDQRSRYQPSSPYAASKAASDHLVRAWHRTYDLPVVITNCSNNYGPWQFPEKLIPLAILNALEGREIPIYGDGMNLRDWIHVEDHCKALLAVLQKGMIGDTYLVSAQVECTNLEIVHMICDAVDRFSGQSPGTSRRLVKFVADRLGHDRRYAIDASATRQKLNWMPSHRIEASLRDLVQWYVDHKTWADEIRSGEYMTYYERQYASK